MQFNINNRVGARFKLIAHKGDGVPVRETDWFNNLVLDAGLDRMSAGPWINRCSVGTGNSTPIPTQTTLDNVKATTTVRKATSSSYVTTGEPYFWYRFTWSFGIGVAAGNISELGLGWTNSNLWNRALVKDGAGQPTTITVLADEYLDVISEVRLYPQQHLSGSFDLRDKNNQIISTHSYTGIPLFGRAGSSSDLAGQVPYFALISIGGSSIANVYEGVIGGSVTTPPTGISYVASPEATSFPNPRTLRGSIQCALSEANSSAGHRSFAVDVGMHLLTYQSWGYQWQIDPPITKNSSQVLTYVLELSWDRYEGP